MYKACKDRPPPIITELFEKWNEHQYNLRHNLQFTKPAVTSVYHGPKIWNILPDRLKKIDSLGASKTAIKSWKPGN